MNSAGSIQAQPTFANALLHTPHEVETTEKGECSTVNDDPFLKSKNVYQNPVTPEQHPKVRQVDMLGKIVLTLFFCSALITFISLGQLMVTPTFVLMVLAVILGMYADFIENYYSTQKHQI